MNTWEQIWQNWLQDGMEFLRHDARKIALVLLLAIIFIKLLRMLTKRLVAFSHAQALPSGLRSRQLRTLAGVINSVGAFVIIFWTAMEILPLLGINMGPLLASAGIAGLAIGFGAQTLVKDVINGFFILLEDQYDLGDLVRVAGVSGTVETMTLRHTTLRDSDGTLHVIPNSEIKIVSNLTRDWAQISLHIAIAYNENSDRVISLLREVGRELHADPKYAGALVSEPEVPGIERVTAGEVDYLMLVKTRPEQRLAVSRELRRRIKECLIKNNIQPGSPARVYVLDAAPEEQTRA